MLTQQRIIAASVAKLMFFFKIAVGKLSFMISSEMEGT